jgi:glycosyltransferase involved in cell wall biosynthesis
VDDLKFSVVIPYRRRLDNIRIVFESLAEQTIGRSRFEVIVGAIEYSEDFIRLCEEFNQRLTIITVMEAGEWNVCRARNKAMRQASGQIIVVLDADMAIPSPLLERLSSEYFSQGQETCVLGRAAGYDDMLIKSDIPATLALPFSHYRELLAELEQNGGVVEDLRDDFEDPQVPWTLVWGGLLALPTALVRQHDLNFDEGFTGWGAEDQELGYRIQAAGIPIELARDIYGLHLPHKRDLAFQEQFSSVNQRYFLSKWPSLSVESWIRFSWREVNLIYRDIEDQVKRCAGGPDLRLGVAQGMVNGDNVLVVGAILDKANKVIGEELHSVFGGDSPRETLPLAGFALPYDDYQFQECHVMPPALCLSERYREAVLAEAGRVASRVLPGPGGVSHQG